MSDIAQRAPNTFYLAGYVGTSFEVVQFRKDGVLQTFEVPSEVVQALEALSTSRDSEVARIAQLLIEDERGGGWLGLAERLYDAGLRFTDTPNA